jgi:hypothetical protein
MPTLISFKHSGKIAALIILSVSVHIVHVLLQFIVNHILLACQDVVSVGYSSCHGVTVLPSAYLWWKPSMIGCLIQVY